MSVYKLKVEGEPTISVGRRMPNIAVTKHRSEDSTAQTPGPPVQAPVAGQVTEHHILTYHQTILYCIDQTSISMIEF